MSRASQRKLRKEFEAQERKKKKKRKELKREFEAQERKKKKPTKREVTLPAKKAEPVTRPSKVTPSTITLQPKKKELTGIAAFREKPTLAGKAVKLLTSTKTTVFLAATLASMGLGAGVSAVIARSAAVRAAPRVISTTISAHKLYRTIPGAEKLIGIGVRSAQQVRRIIGQPAKSGVEKLFKAGGNLAKNAPIVARFATNTKSIGLTSKFLIGAGLSLGAVSIARDIIGTYPFASFGKEESLQVTNFPIAKLIDRGLLDEAEELIGMSDEIINTVPSKIPYKNVLQEFNKYVEAQGKANEGWRKIIEFERNKVPEEDRWVKIYEEQETRRKEQRETDEEYWAGVQENLAKAREEGREEDAQYWADIYERNRERQEASRQEELAEMEWKAEYFDLIREGKFDEAEELLKSQIGGG